MSKAKTEQRRADFAQIVAIMGYQPIIEADRAAVQRLAVLDTLGDLAVWYVDLTLGYVDPEEQDAPDQAAVIATLAANQPLVTALVEVAARAQVTLPAWILAAARLAGGPVAA